jgi:hypothetical protein
MKGKARLRWRMIATSHSDFRQQIRSALADVVNDDSRYHDDDQRSHDFSLSAFDAFIDMSQDKHPCGSDENEQAPKVEPMERGHIS